MKWTVEHYCPNPANNTHRTFSRKPAALNEMRSTWSEEKQTGTSQLINPQGVLVAYRKWNRKKIYWY